MHGYLPAIGFRKIVKKSQFQKIVSAVTASPDSVKMLPVDDESSLTLISKEIAPGIGIAFCGETDKDGNFQMEYHYPYILSSVCSTTAECSVEKQCDRESYSGICDDMRLGLNLIFYVNNFMDYKTYEQMRKEWPKTDGVCLSALSVEGKILLPVKKTAKQLEALKKEYHQCNELMEAAQDGDQEAIEDLAVRDMNLYAQANQRLQKQDLYSVVDTLFMPCGVECDQYTIIGYIRECRKTENSMTGEELYVMDLICNDLPIRLCIAAEDLLGIPKVGHRFKGDIWLQGKGMIS